MSTVRSGARCGTFKKADSIRDGRKFQYTKFNVSFRNVHSVKNNYVMEKHNT